LRLNLAHAASLPGTAGHADKFDVFCVLYSSTVLTADRQPGVPTDFGRQTHQLLCESGVENNTGWQAQLGGIGISAGRIGRTAPASQSNFFSLMFCGAPGILQQLPPFNPLRSVSYSSHRRSSETSGAIDGSSSCVTKVV